MPFQIAWLCSSYAIIFSIGGLLLENGNILWSMIFLILFPVLRIARRFKVISINDYTVFRRVGTAFCARRFSRTAGTESRAHPAMMVHFFMEIT